MKKCPTCHRDYDDSIRFCLEDGATLTRVDQSPQPTMTMPAQPAFRPPPPTLQMPVKPSMSIIKTLTHIFFAPHRVFNSFRDLTTFGPAAVRFLIAAAIIIVAVLAYNVHYFAQIGFKEIARASMEASPRMAERMAELPLEQQERTRRVQESPSVKAITLAFRFGWVILFVVVGATLGALIYWLGAMLLAMLFKGEIKYMQALLVWTYASLPPTVLRVLANMIALLIRPPTTNIGIATGADGVIHANLGAFFDVAAFPIPVHVVALSALDLFEFYGLALAIFGLRKVARIPWLGSFGIVIFVWLIGVVWRIGLAGLVGAIMK